MSSSKIFKAFSSDFLIIGGGIIGLAMATNLSKKFPDATINILEKEDQLGYHTSTRNSGVLHAGFYYSTNSLKAKFCKQGNEFMTNFCEQYNLPLNKCGKIVMPLTEEQNSRVLDLYEQGKKNEVDIKLIDAKEAVSIEPCIQIKNKDFKFLYAKSTKVGHPKEVIKFLEKDIAKNQRISVHKSSKFSKLLKSNEKLNVVEVENTKNKQKQTFQSRFLINCAGLYADKIAKQFNFCKNYTILPFKGAYLIDKNYQQQPNKFQTLLYPMPPQPGFHYLGVHLTYTINNELKLGPTASPILWRQNYQGLENFNFQEFCEISFEHMKNLFSKQGLFYLSLAYKELQKVYKPFIVQEAKKLTNMYDQINNNFMGFPKISNFKYSSPGIRAQLINLKTRKLENDFIVEGDQNSVHFLNVVSPGWTSSFPFTQYVIDKFITNLL